MAAIAIASCSLATSPSLPGTTGTLASMATLRAFTLSPKRAIASCRGPMNSILQLRQTSAKCGILGEKAIAGMDRLHVADLRRANDPVDQQVAFGGGAPADAIGLVGEGEVLGAAVRFTENRDGLDAHFAAGTDNPQGDFTPVGDENSLKHCRLTGADAKKWLSELDGITVLDQDLDDRPADLRRNLIEDFHRLDDANHRLRQHGRADIHKRRVVRGRRRIVRSDRGTVDCDGSVAFGRLLWLGRGRGARGRLERGRRGARDDHWGACFHAAPQTPFLVAALQADLRQAVLFHQLDERKQPVEVEGCVGGGLASGILATQ